jgi:hypothetical protein
MLFQMRVRRMAEAPEDASRCPVCKAVMPTFDGLDASVGVLAAEVTITKIAFSVACTCGTDVVITLRPGYRILRSDAEGEKGDRS